jgi:hypothetical protein
VTMARIEGKAVFLNRLQYEEIPGTKFIRLLEDFIVYSAVLNRIIIVPKGFTCDGESVFFKSSTEAGVVHDYLYRIGAKTWNIACTINIPFDDRRKADAVFYEVSDLDGCWKITSLAKWAAVRCVSWIFYRKKKVSEP